MRKSSLEGLKKWRLTMSNKKEIDRVAEALKQHPTMSNKQLKAFYLAVVEIGTNERGLRRKAREMQVFIKAEMMCRGI